MKYGYFDDAKREYVITNPRTPVKWINYVGTLAFGGLVDHTGGSLICKQDPALNRITKYIPQLPASEFKGETLYLRFPQEGGYRVFSPFFVPTLDPYERYECHVGLGYTRIISEFYGIRSEITIFVPPGESLVIRDIQVSNVSGKPVDLDVIPVVEYTHFDALKQFTNADWIPQTMQSQAACEDDGQVILVQFPFMNRERQVNYFTSNHAVASFETDRRRFLGDNEYGTWANPLSLQQENLSSYEALRGDNIAALLHHLGELRPGESKRLITQLGQAASIDTARDSIDRFCQQQSVNDTLESLHQFWDGYLSALQVETPEPSMNSMLNVHHPRQCHTTKNWSRYLSLYQLGLGARGIGFRDSSQDVMGVIAHMPDESRALIEQLLRVQKRNGAAMHQFNPLTMEANAGDSRWEEEAPKYYSDDHLWINLAICAYLKETGDFDFLDREIPYYEKDKTGEPLESGTVWDHMQRGVAFTRHDLGAHGLPLLGFADWNDTINLAAGAESVFTANLYGKVLRELMALSEYLGDAKTAETYAIYYEDMKTSVNEHCWDGEWYIRYFEANGQPIGSHQNLTGKIFANAQSWSVISGFAPPDRARLALASVNRWLNTSHGIKLSTPGYTRFDPAIGGVSTYPPGAKENGGIFLHANPWVMIAETLMGSGDRAFEYYHQINPAAKNDSIDIYECEPYVYAQNILGDEHPQFGLGRNSWLSGTASWVYQTATQYILGVMPTYEGLKINPCIPQAWDRFQVTRQYRGAAYRITVQNPTHVSCGVQSLYVDGKAVDGQIVPAFQDGKIHQVDLVMG